MPPAHQQFAAWSPERIQRWAQSIGPDTTKLIDALFATRRHPQQAFRSCLGILKLGQRYGKDRLEAACRRALPAGIRSYQGIKNILDAKLDQLAPEQAPPLPLPSHPNIRGATYYH